MPQRMWKHNCRDGGTSWFGSPGRCSCGVAYEYDGWFNTRMEAMAWYQRLYGLKPIGPHRPLADKVLSRADRSCRKCSGRGYRDVLNGESYDVCTSCHGAGRSLVISDEELARLRSIILDKYPEAGAPSAIADPQTGVVLHDLDKGEMIVDAGREGKSRVTDDRGHARKHRELEQKKRE
jgi:hypothetical protein